MLLRLLPAGAARRFRLRPPAAKPAAGRWDCLDLAGQPATEVRLRTARELVVRQPAELTLDVLSFAPGLVAVVLPLDCRLPWAVTAELARRGIATVWRLPPAAATMPPATTMPAAAPMPVGRHARAFRSRALVDGGCTVSRRGPLP